MKVLHYNRVKRYSMSEINGIKDGIFLSVVNPVDDTPGAPFVHLHKDEENGDFIVSVKWQEISNDPKMGTQYLGCVEDHERV